MLNLLTFKPFDISYKQAIKLHLVKGVDKHFNDPLIISCSPYFLGTIQPVPF